MRHSAAYSRRRNLLADESDTTGQLADFTVNYTFEDETAIAGGKWTLGAGYSYGRNDESETVHILSILLTLDLEGSTEKDEDGED